MSTAALAALALVLSSALAGCGEDTGVAGDPGGSAIGTSGWSTFFGSSPEIERDGTDIAIRSGADTVWLVPADDQR